MHYHQAPESGAHQQSQQFSVSPDLLLSNELKIKYRKLDPCTTDEINILLLENISSKAVKIFKDVGFNVIDIISNSFLIIFQG
jgi:predicted Fe-Mo cluster-binding NifX family protein